MNILSVESSCDETAVAIVRDGREILTDCIASQVELHKLYGGVVPEIASRKHIEAIYGLADQSLETSGLRREDLDAIAVTDVYKRQKPPIAPAAKAVNVSADDFNDET